MKPQVFIITRWPIAHCVQAERPPSGGGPGSFHEDLVLIRLNVRLVPFPSFCGSLTLVGKASLLVLTGMHWLCGSRPLCSDELLEWAEEASASFSTSIVDEIWS